MNLPINIRELKPDQQVLIELLKEQLLRDLSKVGIATFPDTQLTRWISELAQLLQQLEKEHQLDQFLYLVDLPENWSRVIQHSSDPFENLAEAVLQREWQKVYCRKMHTHK